MDDPYLRTRKDDVDHVVTRIQRILLGDSIRIPILQDNEQLRGAIVVAHDLTPAETALLQHQGIAGFVTESGGPLSHTAILARSLGLPAIVGTHVHASRRYAMAIPSSWMHAQGPAADGVDERSLKKYRRRATRGKKAPRVTSSVSRTNRLSPSMAPISTCWPMSSCARTYSPHAALAAEGIGLYRTEFLFMNRSDIPDEE